MTYFVIVVKPDGRTTSFPADTFAYACELFSHACEIVGDEGLVLMANKKGSAVGVVEAVQ